MAKIRDPQTRELREATSEELEIMRIRIEKKAAEEVARRQATAQTTLEASRGETKLAQQSWQARIRLLDQKRLSPNESLIGAIEIQDMMIFSLMHDHEVFEQWMQLLYQEYESLTEQIKTGVTDPESQATRDVMRAFGYCVRLAENIEVARFATKEEKEKIEISFAKNGKPPFGLRVITYKHEWRVIANRNIFHGLEQLRRAHKKARIAIKEAEEDNNDPEKTSSVEISAREDNKDDKKNDGDSGDTVSSIFGGKS